MADLSPDFGLAEFKDASHRALTAAEREKAGRFARELLQPIRNVFGPVCVTSFVRSPPNVGSGPHANGDAVDFVPCSRSKATMARMHLFAGLFLRDRFGKLILEDNHIHATLPGVQGVTGERLVEVGRDDDGLQLRRGMILSAALVPLALIAIGIRVLTSS